MAGNVDTQYTEIRLYLPCQKYVNHPIFVICDSKSRINVIGNYNVISHNDASDVGTCICMVVGQMPL